MSDTDFIMPIMELHEEISKHLKDNKISVYSLAIDIDVSPSHLYKLLRKERPFLQSNLIKLNAVLNTNFQEPDTP